VILRCSECGEGAYALVFNKLWACTACGKPIRTCDIELDEGEQLVADEGLATVVVT